MACLYKNGNLFWIAYYYNGKLYRESLKTKDRATANYLKNKKEQEIAEGKLVIPNLNSSCEEILKNYESFCQFRKTAMTLKDDLTRIRRFFTWSSITRVNQITEKKLQDYLDNKIKGDKNKGITLNTANHTITSLKTFLNFAIRRQYIYDNPIRHFKKYKLPSNPPRFLTREEIVKLQNIAKYSKLYHPIMTALYTGARKQELFTLEWPDIDWVHNTITIKNKDGFTTKSKRFRAIPLHPALKAILEPLKQESGRLFDITNHRKLFGKLITHQDVKMEDVGWHTLRHTFASHLAMQGVDLFTIKELLGHASVVTTQIYAHLTKDHIKDAVEKLDFYS